MITRYESNNRLSKAVVAKKPADILKKCGVVHRADYWNSFMALTRVCATPASSGMPAKLQASTSCRRVVCDASACCMIKPYAPEGLLLAATTAAI